MLLEQLGDTGLLAALVTVRIERSIALVGPESVDSPAVHGAARWASVPELGLSKETLYHGENKIRGGMDDPCIQERTEGASRQQVPLVVLVLHDSTPGEPAQVLSIRRDRYEL